LIHQIPLSANSYQVLVGERWSTCLHHLKRSDVKTGYAMNTRTFLPRLLIVLSLLCFSCRNNSDHEESTVGPGNASSQLEEIFSLAGQNANLKCLIVYKDDHIVKERYFHPGDSLLPHDVRSVTKSVMATLMGIAVDKGIIPAEDRPIGDYVQALVDSLQSAKAGITIRDVLTMSSGLSGNDLPDVLEYNNWFNAPNQVAYTLNQSVIHQPGQVFGYNTGAAHLTSAILTQAGGTTTFQFAKQHLFQPLGIADHSWGTDKQGIYNGGAALSLTPYDMLRIGQLYLNKGMYNGVRVVSEAWIERASTFKITTNGAQPFGPGYGYFWWIGNTARHGYFFANGYGGQFIVVVPDIRLIVIATNTWSNVPLETANRQWYSTLDMIMSRIISLYE
jgi:CubicO group peptidase (beta-lactamase class C family)